MTARTIHSIHYTREDAEKVERELQAALDAGEVMIEGMPDWANGVRVENAGENQHAVVFTPNKGH